MIKLILCIVVVLSSTLVGFSFSSRLSSRKSILEAFVIELKNCATQIRYSSGDLSQIFSNNFMSYSFSDSKPFYQQWTDMLSTYSKVLTKKDIEVLTDFAHTLGTCDIAGEINNIELHIEMLNAQITDAQSQITTKSKLYKTLGVSLGLVVAILLI